MGFEAFVNGIAFPVTADIRGLIEGLGQVDAKLTAQEQAFQRGTKVIQDWGIKAGLAITGVGVAMSLLTKNAAVVNADLGITGIVIGKSTEEMRNLATATANADFPLSEVVSTFDLLAKAGMRNTTEMQRVANVIDTIGDASGNTAVQVADALIPAFAAFDIPLTDIEKHMDSITYLTENSNVSFDAFASVTRTLGADLNAIGFTFEDTEALLMAMSDAGIPAEKATRKLRSAISEYNQALEDQKTAQKEVIDTGKKLATQKEDLAELEADYAKALQKAGDTSKAVARIELDYSKQVAAAKKDLTKLEEDYQKALKKAQDTTKDEAKLKKSFDKEIAASSKESAKLEADYAKDKEDLDREARLNWMDQSGNARKSADLEESYAERRLSLSDRLSETTTDYNDRLLEIKDTSEAVANLNERYAEQKQTAQDRINDQVVTYNERLTEAKDTTEAVAAVEERYTKQIADKNKEIAETTIKFNDVKLASENFKSGMEALLEKVKVTPDEFKAAQDKIVTNSEGYTQKIAGQANTQFTSVDRVKAAWDNFALSMGSAILPFEMMGTVLAMTGPMMMGLAGLMTMIPFLSGTALPALSVALAFLAANPIILVIAAVALLVLGLYYLETKFHWIEALMVVVGVAWTALWDGMVWAVQGAANLISGVIDGMVNGIKWAVNIVIDGVNTMINGVNSVSSLGGLTGNMFALPTIPRLASGGIVTSPTIAMIGEAGPEAVVPLSRGGGAAGGITITGNTFVVRNDQDIKLVAIELKSLIDRSNRGRGAAT